MWQGIELRELRLFVVLAEELHFGRTAERLGLTPSRVSQSLRALEDKLGAQLLFRTSRRVSLTPFGERFLGDVATALEQLDGVLERSASSARTLEGTLRIGLLSGPAGGPRLVELVGAFESAHPECSVEVVQLSWENPVAVLREGVVDALATWVPLEQADLTVGPTLSCQARVLAVAAAHPLAERESVDIEELAEHRVIRFDDWPAELREAVMPARTPTGRVIRGTPTGTGDGALRGISLRVARGDVALPTVRSAASYMGEFDVVFVPLTGLEPLRSALVWRRPARDPTLRAFVDVARSVLAD